jgi:hypothetical protein
VGETKDRKETKRIYKTTINDKLIDNFPPIPGSLIDVISVAS